VKILFSTPARRVDAHSWAQIDRILDPDKGNITIETLQRAAALVGRQLRSELV
jgi:antitoxin HicB